MKNPLQALVCECYAFSTVNEPNAVSERAEIASSLYCALYPFEIKQKTLVLIKSYCFRFLDRGNLLPHPLKWTYKTDRLASWAAFFSVLVRTTNGMGLGQRKSIKPAFWQRSGRFPLNSEVDALVPQWNSEKRVEMGLLQAGEGKG